MNWHHWYWWTLPAGAAIGVVIVCVVNYVVSEIGRRRMMAQIHAARDAAASRHEMSRKTSRPYPDAVVLNIAAEGDAAPSLPTRRTSRRRPRETGPTSEEAISQLEKS